MLKTSKRAGFFNAFIGYFVKRVGAEAIPDARRKAAWMVALETILLDLLAESRALDDLVAVLGEADWAIQTPAAGWSIAHQIGHLAWTDANSLLAATDPIAFRAQAEQAFSGAITVDSAAADWAKRPPARLLEEWRDGRARLAQALSEVPEGEKLPWFGPPMSAASMATARIMETWAHGQDVADALAIEREPGDRLRQVAHLAVRTRDFAFSLHRIDPPAEEFRVCLQSPDGAEWVWGPATAAQSVRGPALDFCLLATQRRHRADTELTAEGPEAEQWLDIIQAFAGPPGAGRTPFSGALGAAE